MPLISVIVPCYNEEESIPIFYKEINKICKTINDVSWEFIFIDDGSKDQTVSILKTISKQDIRVKYLSFSRNFGKESAMYAGMKVSMGNYVTIMDVDLQDPPELLKEMYSCMVTDSYDCVAARRATRKGEPIIRSFFAKCFYKLINKISQTEIVDGARDFRMMTRKMVDAILSLPEYNRFSKGIFSWVGFKTKWIEYINVKRVAGETKWSFWKLFLYSLDGIIAFSTVPLAVSSVIGFIFCIISLVMAGIYLIKTIMWGDPVTGFPTLICVILFVGGIQLFCMGILGQYLSKIYLEEKHRPIYILKEDNLHEVAHMGNEEIYEQA